MEKSYTAQVSRSGKWWHVAVPEAGKFAMTQARRLKEIEPMTRDLLATIFDAPAESFTVVIVFADPEYSAAEAAVAEARLRAAAAEREALEQTKLYAKHFSDKGLPVRDIAELLHISSSRVSELTRAA